MEKKRINIIAEEFHLSQITVKKYLNMSLDDIRNLDNPKDYKKRKTLMDDYINIIYKMLRDGLNEETIFYYVRYKGYDGKLEYLCDYIYFIGKNNFSNRNRNKMNPYSLMDYYYPKNITVIKRSNLLKYLLTINPKTKKDNTIEENIAIIKGKYSIVEKIEEMFRSFHTIIMGSDPNGIDTYIEKYKDSEIKSFCDGIKKDIAPVKNAISYEVSSGFVEGNNNKFKLIKRIVYGRSKLVNLSKKCFLAFSIKRADFNLLDLI